MIIKLNQAQTTTSFTCHCPLTSITSSSSSSELLALPTFPPFTSSALLWPSDRAEGEKEEGEDEEELEALVGGYWERKLAPAGPGVAAGPGSPPGSIEPV